MICNTMPSPMPLRFRVPAATITKVGVTLWQLMRVSQCLDSSLNFSSFSRGCLLSLSLFGIAMCCIGIAALHFFGNDNVVNIAQNGCIPSCDYGCRQKRVKVLRGLLLKLYALSYFGSVWFPPNDLNSMVMAIVILVCKVSSLMDRFLEQNKLALRFGFIDGESC
jgi:hypothetical protein